MWAFFKPLTYNRTYEYPAWAQGLGMCLAFSSMLCIPVYFGVMLIITPGSFKEVNKTTLEIKDDKVKIVFIYLPSRLLKAA